MGNKMISHQENVIREKRTIEATKKNLMGPSGKFGTILQAFGAPVMRHGSGLFDVNYLDDPYEDSPYTEYSSMMSDQVGPVAYKDELLMAGDENVYTEGLVFDGLSRGMHLDITYWHDTNEIKVSYRGHLVYHEVAGELNAYAPFPEWENLIERLSKAAKDRVKQMKEQKEVNLAERIHADKRAFWQRLRTRWGI
jgi:hypothetical protein